MSQKKETVAELEKKNTDIQINHRYFTISLLELLEMALEKSNTLNLDTLDVSIKKNVKTIKDHTKFRGVCNELKKGFSEKNEEFDQGRIIKKVYKVLTQHFDMIYPDSNNELFTLKNEKNQTVTIIPGLDLNVVVELMDDAEKKLLWGYIYFMYVSSVSMISLINDHKKEGKSIENLPKLKTKILESGVMQKNSKLFNPFFGLIGQEESKNDYSVEKMYENVEGIKSPEEFTVDAMMKMTGIDKLFDSSQLNDQLRGIGQEDISDATSNIAKLLGAEGDSDINEICGSLVKGIISDLKDNPTKGFSNMFETAKSVTEKIGKTLDGKKMEKTANKVFSFLKNGKENLKNMKDDSGNPIGEKLMSSLAGPLQMVEKLGAGASPEDYKNLFSQVSNAVSGEVSTLPKKN